MEISETTLALVRLCQFNGIAPYKIVRNKANKIVDLKLNPMLCLYSVLFMIVCSVSSSGALLFDVLLTERSLRYRKMHLLLLWIVHCISLISNKNFIFYMFYYFSLQNENVYVSYNKHYRYDYCQFIFNAKCHKCYVFSKKYLPCKSTFSNGK